MIEILDDIYDTLVRAWKARISVILSIVVYILLSVAIPIWIIPYLIYKKRRDKKEDLENE